MGKGGRKRIALEQSSYLIPFNQAVNPDYADNYISTAKYNKWTFLPLNLFEQFRRFSNLYFLTAAIIALIPGLSPIPPATQVAPLVFVLFVAAVKDGYEDYLRHQADEEANSSPCKALRSGAWEEVPSRDLKVGDFVRVENKGKIPADLILLSADGEDGVAYIETSNLDGETNLKRRNALTATEKTMSSEAALAASKARIECEPPNEKIYSFVGRHIDEEGTASVLEADNMLLRGSALRNTKWAHGVVVYAGNDTKLMQNASATPSRFSKLETRLNRTVLFIFVIYGLLIALNATLAGIDFQANIGVNSELYLDTIADEAVGDVIFEHVLTYFVLYSYMIPISLFVTIEVVRVIQARFMEWDTRMPGMKARNSGINEELGQIEHIFSDKTGTLTQNIMKAAKFSVHGKIYTELNRPGSLLEDISEAGGHTSELALEYIQFLRCLSLNHSVVPEEGEGGKVQYQAQSPDELALIEAAVDNKVKLQSRHGATTTLIVDETPEEWEVLAEIEFNSDRKRSSIIVRSPAGQIYIYAKGADAVLLPLLAPGQKTRLEKLNAHLTQFSQNGLRTLVIAYRTMTDEEWESWSKAWQTATTDISDRRNAMIAETAARLERDFLLLGATAIEDKLQENCPETIAYLLAAGIKVWVLTGDKQETAINIGYSTKLLTPSQYIMIVNATSEDETIKLLTKYIQEESRTDRERALVIDGHTLGFALKGGLEEFIRLGTMCKSLICCRVTPLQKALVVRGAKNVLKRTCLAVGDGANDVSMIQEANVGVGIAGLEGTQAVRASDFAINEFQHLKPLIAIHGRYNYSRFAGLMQYSFYKNMAFILPQLPFGFYSGHTGQTLYEGWILTAFNMLFTLMPPFVYGLFEKDLTEDMIYKHPAVYARNQRDTQFSWGSFLSWMCASAWHGAVFWFVCWFAWPEVIYEDGKVAGHMIFGLTMSTMAINVVNLKFALFVNYWTWLTHIAVWGSLAINYLFILGYSTEFLSQILNEQMTSIWGNFVVSTTYWAILVLGMALALMPDLMIKYLRRQIWPADWQVLQEAAQRVPGSPLNNGPISADNPPPQPSTPSKA